MKITEIYLKNDPARKHVLLARYRGTDEAEGLGACSVGGPLCEFHNVSGGLVVTEPRGEPVAVLAKVEMIPGFLKAKYPEAVLNAA